MPLAPPPPTHPPKHTLIFLVLLMYTGLQVGVGLSLVGRQRRGTCPSRFVKASASVHRHIMQQLEKMKLIEQDSDNG